MSSPRPKPQSIVELQAIDRLVAAGSIVVCAGGGGIPVVADSGGLRGVEAVIDKDLTAALLAEELGAEKLIVLTDVPYVERDWGTATATPIEAATPAELRELSFAAGSMGPKVEAACRFVERTGGEAFIGSLAELDAISRGEAGTRIAAAASLSQLRSSPANSAAVCGWVRRSQAVYRRSEMGSLASSVEEGIGRSMILLCSARDAVRVAQAPARRSTRRPPVHANGL